ncbi:carbohydrate ABC transporter permease [Ruminococcaceae bacterium OttesenSCG-928-L11]|nr:carbohydrate ABC transporter permease [Ruminococcaceae bacterium OttesenSCG-928-L11]
MFTHNKAFQVGANFIMILLSLTCILPFILLISASITNESSLLMNGYAFFPQEISWDAYKFLLYDSSSIVRGYGITIFVTAVGTTANLLLTILLAYPLSRPDLPGKNTFSFLVYFTMLFNGGLVPSYIMWTQAFHIKNTIWALIVPSLMLNAFYVIMMRTYFTSNIPNEIIEAARIDSAGEMRILFTVVLPMSLPMIATLCLMVGLGYWNNWTNGLYYLTDSSLFSIQNILNRMLQDAQFLASGMAGEAAAELAAQLPTTGIRMGVAVLGALPIMLIYPFFQKYFVKGITIGAVKG